MPTVAHKNDDLADLKQALSTLPLKGGERAFSKIAGEFLNRHGDRFRVSKKPEPLSPAEIEALRSVGVDTDTKDLDTTPVVQMAANYAALLATAQPLAEVATKLGVTDGRLRQRVGNGTLLAVRGPDGRSLRIPVFQLTETGELPGLRDVLRAVRRDIRPVQVASFFTTPQPDLEDADGTAMTPVAWLLAGNDPAAVRDLAQHL